MADTTPTQVPQPIPPTLTPSVIRPDGQERAAFGVERQAQIARQLGANRTPVRQGGDRSALPTRPITQTQNQE
jgi:hypothetical protein